MVNIGVEGIAELFRPIFLDTGTDKLYTDELVITERENFFKN